MNSQEQWIDLKGRLVKTGIRERQVALSELVHAIREYRKIAESKPLTLQGSDYAHAVQELNKSLHAPRVAPETS